MYSSVCCGDSNDTKEYTPEQLEVERKKWPKVDKLYDVVCPMITDFFYKISNEKHSIDNLNPYFRKYEMIIQRFMIKQTILGNYSFTKEENNLFSYLYKLIAYTRDINYGLGHRDITYMMISIWNEYFPECCDDLVKNMYTKYGTWEDVKLFANYFYEHNTNKKNGLKETFTKKFTNYNAIDNFDNLPHIINYSFDLMVDAINTDYKNFYNNRKQKVTISNVCKWVPREKSVKYGWIFKILAVKFWNKQMKEFKIYNNNKDVFITEVYKFFRKTVTELNKYIETVQIHQCNNEWDKIDFNKVTMKTREKQRNAFLNINNDFTKRWKHNSIRDTCSDKFKVYETKRDIFEKINDNPTDEELINMITTYDYSERYLEIRNYHLHDSIIKLWKQNADNYDNENLKYIIPIIDSNSIICDRGKNAYSCNIKLLATYLRLLEKSFFNDFIFIDSKMYIYKNRNIISRINFLLKIMQNKADVNTEVIGFPLDEQWSGTFYNSHKYYKDRIDKLESKTSFNGVYLYNGCSYKYKEPKIRNNLINNLGHKGEVEIDYSNTYNINFNADIVDRLTFLRGYNEDFNKIFYTSIRNTIYFNNKNTFYHINYYLNYKSYLIKNGFNKSECIKNYNDIDNFINTVDRDRYNNLSPYY